MATWPRGFSAIVHKTNVELIFSTLAQCPMKHTRTNRVVSKFIRVRFRRLLHRPPLELNSLDLHRPP
jgi:hypothetical protein